SFMFVLTLLLQAGLGQSPLHAGIEVLPLAAAFTAMSILSPRFSARLGARSITLGASITTLGTIALAATGARYGAGLTGWDRAPAVAIAAAMTWLRPRCPAARQVSPGRGEAVGQAPAPAPAVSHRPSPAREHVASAAD